MGAARCRGGGEKVAARNFVDGAKDLEGKVILADAIHTDSKLVTAVSKKKLSMRIPTLPITDSEMNRSLIPI